MDYEKKKMEALEELKQCDRYDIEPAKTILKIFPELEESDYVIKQRLIHLLGYFRSRGIDYNLCDRILNWLEKQRDTNETINRDKFAQSVLKGAAINLIAWIDYNAAEGNMCLSNMECNDIEDALVSGNWDKIYAYIKKKLERQGEQNPTDKVEPRFKVGDWIVFNNDHDSIYQIEKIENYEYILRHILGGSMSLSFSHGDMIRAWTIQDAKDGDVLVADDNEPFIFKGLLDTKHPNYPVAYCGLDSEDYFIVSRSNIWWTDEYVKPATKEQRDLLFSKMKEAGYEWDAEKKVLVMVGIDNDKEDEQYEELMEDDETNIEQNFTDSYCKEHCKGFQETGKCFADGECKAKIDEKHKVGKYFTGLIPCWVNAPSTLQPAHNYHGKNIIAIHLKDGGYRCCCIDDKKPVTFSLPENTPLVEGWKRKSAEWSDEDEKIIETMCKEGDLRPSQMIWLKSLKDRVQPHWKPTEEQMNALKQTSENDYVMYNTILKSLYNDLKNFEI